MEDNFDLSGLADAALAQLGSVLDGPPPADPAPVADKSVEAPTPESEAPPPEDAAPPKEDTPPPVFKVKVDGEEVEVPLDELTKGYSRTSVWTKRMQALADERKAFEAAVAQARTEVQSTLTAAQEREKALNSFYSDPTNVKLWYETITKQPLLTAQQQESAGFDPGTVPTLEDVQRLVKSQIAEVQQTLQKELSGTREQLQKEWQEQQAALVHRAQAAEHQTVIEQHIEGLLAKHPFLSVEENVGEHLAEEALRLNPTSLKDALEMLDAIAEQRATRWTTKVQELTKTATAEKQKLVTHGIEPPGGAPPVEAEKKFSLGDDGLTKKAEAYLASLMKG